MKVGDTVPEFELADQHGTTHSLDGLLAGGPIVLFFYPKAMTPGCTKESCHFRDLAGELAEVGARAVGISADPPDKQAEFDGKHSLGMILLSDTDRRVAAALGAKRPGPLTNRRMSFVIGRDRTLLGIVKSEVNMDAHADRALDLLRGPS